MMIYVHDGTKRHLGHFVEPQWGTERLEDGGFKVQGCLPRIPAVGDFVRLSDFVYKFIDVTKTGNPKDFFFGEIELWCNHQDLEDYLETHDDIQPA